jgi:hypothetical protein
MSSSSSDSLACAISEQMSSYSFGVSSETSSSSQPSNILPEIRVPYNGAGAILVDGVCYVLQEITYGQITHIAVDGEYKTCEDCIDKQIESSIGNPEIPKYPPTTSSSVPSMSITPPPCPCPSDTSSSSCADSSTAPSYEPSSTSSGSSG